jgi:hypothetical protein
MNCVLTAKEFVKRLGNNDIEIKRVRADGVRGAGFSGYKYKQSFLDELNEVEADED